MEKEKKKNSVASKCDICGLFHVVDELEIITIKVKKCKICDFSNLGVVSSINKVNVNSNPYVAMPSISSDFFPSAEENQKQPEGQVVMNKEFFNEMNIKKIENMSNEDKIFAESMINNFNKKQESIGPKKAIRPVPPGVRALIGDPNKIGTEDPTGTNSAMITGGTGTGLSFK